VKPTINTATSHPTQKKVSEPYESMEDWFRSQKDMPDSAEDQENLYASIRSLFGKRDSTSPYEDIEELANPQSKAKTLQTHTSDSHMEYITILADTERADCTSEMTRSQSDPHSLYSSKNNYTLVSEDSLESNSPPIPVRKHSQHGPLPPLPNLSKHHVNSIPTVDTSPPQDLSSPNTLASTDEELYIEVLADAERADCASEMTRSQSHPHLRYSSKRKFAQLSEDSLECNSLQTPVCKHSQHGPLPPLPNLPKHHVNSIPTVDTSPPQDLSSPITLASTDEELYIEIDATFEDKVRNSGHKEYRRNKQTHRSPAVSLDTTDISSQYKPRLSHSSEDIPDTTSSSTVRPKQIQTTSSLGISRCGTNSQLRLKSHSSGQVNMLSTLDKEVYHFISNSLHPERKGNSQSSLNEIFGRYCQNEKAVSLDNNKLPSECSSLCSSVEPLSDNSGTASPVEQNTRTLNGSRIMKAENNYFCSNT